MVEVVKEVKEMEVKVVVAEVETRSEETRSLYLSHLSSDAAVGDTINRHTM